MLQNDHKLKMHGENSAAQLHLYQKGDKDIRKSCQEQFNNTTNNNRQNDHTNITIIIEVRFIDV